MQDIFERLAAIHNCPVETVKAEISGAIRKGLDSRDPAVQKKWKQVSQPGEEPTAEDVLAYCVAETLRRRENIHGMSIPFWK